MNTPEMDPASPVRPVAGEAAWRAASPADADAVLAAMREFYAEERLVFDAAAQGAALRELLAKPELGAVFFVCRETADTGAGGGEGADGGAPRGYLVLTWACSLEFGGRFVLLDELWLAPELRGRGQGRRAVELAAAWAREQGAKALRLEVAHENTRARATYAKAGLEAHARDFMTRRLA
jgi:ribosomal protein S18 acetylase RimI-like enzyme